LQDTLGNWHDCVVERGLLETLRHELGRMSRQPGLSVVAMLLNRVDARQQAYLDKARALLASGKELRTSD
jgi:CHAD domain-containing protein